jgi:hypothetical protein
MAHAKALKAADDAADQALALCSDTTSPLVADPLGGVLGLQGILVDYLAG